MQRDVNKNISSHPSSKELADFVEGTLDEAKKAEITKHLIACDECSDVVALVMKYGKKKPKVMNNIYYRGLGVALVASVVLFMVMPTKDNRPFIDFYTSVASSTFNAGAKAEEIKDIKKANQEINNFLIEITKSTDMSYLKEFNQAEEKLKRKEFDNARDLYQEAMNIIDDEMPNLNKKEKDKQHIIITYKILLLSIAEDDSESANEYKSILRDDVRRFKKRWIEASNRKN